MNPVTLWHLRNLPYRLRGAKQELLFRAKLGLTSSLALRVTRRDGRIEDYGIVSRRVVTTAGATKLADSMCNLFEPENFNYHAFGTSATAEATTDTALAAEVGTRVSGTQSKPSGLVYRTVGVWTFPSTVTVQEHGLLSAAAAGTLLDRTAGFTGIPGNAGDTITATYDFTINAGG